MASNKIILKGDGTQVEALANGAITPGHLVQRDAAGTLSVHSSAGENAEPIFAYEDELQGKVKTQAYADGSRVLARIMRVGDQVQGILANGETAVIGSFLESAGDGTLQVVPTDSAGVVKYPASVVAVALEAVDMSSSSGADPSGYIAIEIVK